MPPKKVALMIVLSVSCTLLFQFAPPGANGAGPPANGVLVPNADNLISFKVTGPGFVAAVDNGDNASHELFQTNSGVPFRENASR